MKQSVILFSCFPPPFTGRGTAKRWRGRLPRKCPLRLASLCSLDTSPVNGGGKLQTPRNEQLHDLVGAAIDALYAAVRIHARDGVFVHVAITAEKLQAFVHDLALQIAEPQ